jgi:hypothetical protein
MHACPMLGDLGRLGVDVENNTLPYLANLVGALQQMSGRVTHATADASVYRNLP